MGLAGDRGRLTAETLGAPFGAASWRHQLPAQQDTLYHTLLASPAVADGFVVFGTYDNRLRALREQDGALLWEVLTSDTVLASPAIDHGRAYAASVDGQIIAVSLSDGSLLWKRAAGGAVYGAPTLADGALYVAVGNPAPAVMRLRPEDGQVVWTTATGGGGGNQQAAHSGPAVAGGHVVVGESNGVWRCFRATDGAPEWTAELGGVVQMTGALIRGGTVFIAPADATLKVHALDLATGRARDGWPVTIPLPADPQPGTRTRTGVVPSSLVDAGAGRIALQVRRDERIDANRDGAIDAVPMNEFLVALSADSGTLAWLAPGARKVASDENGVPTFGVSATPAAFVQDGGTVLLASVSTLEGTLRVVDAASGVLRATRPVGGPTRGSPVVANGAIITGSDDGSVARWPSMINQPPPAPDRHATPAPGATIDAAQALLSWAPVLEPDGDAVSYIVRWDDDGEVLRDWDGEMTTAPEQTGVRPRGLTGGTTYTWAVRARDARGALSGWSELRQFLAVTLPQVQVRGQTYRDLQSALAAAAPGDLVALGPGLYPLTAPLALPNGVTVAGLAPHLTLLRGDGLEAGVIVAAGSARSTLRGVTVSGATVGVRVDTGEDVELRNVILRDNREAGLRVQVGARARLISATIMRNATGVDALGSVEARNVLVTTNGYGLAATGLGGRIVTRFSDVYNNQHADRVGTALGTGDRMAVVQFADGIGTEARLEDAQPTTDEGDPDDDFAEEPAPNGGRINIGAFGNTPFAELSGPRWSQPQGGAPVADEPSTDTAGGAGCALAGTPNRRGTGGGLGCALLATVMVALRRRRR